MKTSIPPSVALILEDVAQANGLSLQDMMRSRRHRRITWPRQEAMARIRDEIRINGAPASYPLIARWMGFKDHTTIVHGVKAFQGRQEAAE